jgi:hypothetical protein
MIKYNPPTNVFLPAVIVIAFNMVAYILFFFGPFDFAIDNAGSVGVLSFFCLAFFVFGQVVGNKPIKLNELKVKMRINPSSTKMLFFANALLLSSIFFYTNKLPWDFNSYLFRQSVENYQDSQAFLAGSRDGRIFFIFVKIFFQPFLMYALFSNLMNWKELKLLTRALTVSIFFTWALLSIARGTDKEIGDILLVVFVFFISKIQTEKLKLLDVVRYLLAIFLAISLFLTIFSQRKLERLGTDRVCLYEINLCSNFDIGDSFLADQFEFTYSIFSSYISQGYYGLSLALKEDFDSTFGLGHSSVLLDLSSAFVGPDFAQRSYMVKIEKYHWDSKMQWSTAYIALASDMSFYLVPVFIFLMSLVLTLSWKLFLKTKSVIALCLFYYTFVFFMYLPANNQVFLTADSYLSFLFFLFASFIGMGKSNKTEVRSSYAVR